MSYYLQLQRATSATSSYVNYATYSAGTTTAYDTNVILNGTYYYRVFATGSLGSSSFSNTTSLFINPLIAYEPWDEYTLGQSFGFTSGSGWAGPWKISLPAVGIVAVETFNRFILGQSASFNDNITIYGWVDAWTVVDGNNRTIASESFNNYFIGQASSFVSGSGWNGAWTVINGNNRTIASESFEEYTLGQTSSFYSASGFINPWRIQISGTL